MPKDLVAASSRLQEWLKYSVEARTEAVEKENEQIREDISQLKHQLYSSKFIHNPIKKEDL